MDAAHSRWWQVFEVVFGVPFLAALALQRVVPWSLPHALRSPALVSGVALIAAGVTLVVLARRALAQHHQPTDPGHPTRMVVTTGVFAMSRNPLYLGGVAIVLGIALAFDLPWVLVSLVPALFACHYVLIAPEERYLAIRFGEPYRAYAASVPRWIGRAPGRR